jgi:poly(A) polymerase
MHETSTKRPSLFETPDEEHDSGDRERGEAPRLALDPPEEPAPEHAPEIPVERLDPDALKVIARLRHMRHQAYLVGGCVRDLLLDRTPKDFDVATDAHPGEVRAIFRNCRLIGRRFRLAHVYFRGGKFVEVATFRKNPVDVGEDVPDAGDLLITRDNVFGTAEEDAVRRDFTVNGLFYDVARGEVIDYVGGRADLEAHRIATIGDPEIRIREDPVRALRAVRFAARLGFIISPDTFEAMRRHAGELARCAPPRVLEEIFKILRCGGAARAFELLRACGALAVVLPAVGAGLDTWDEARRRSFFAHLAALDRLVRSGEEVSDAVLLGALLMHLAPRARAEGQPDEAGSHRSAPRLDEAFLSSLVSTSRLPRKVAERTRLALHAQRGLRDPQRRRRRRGRGAAGQPQVADAVQLLRITVDATGEGSELLERLAAPAHQDPAPPHGADRAEAAEAAEAAAERIHEVDVSGGPHRAPAGADEAPGAGRRRRRRRGGRRRRRRGPGTDAPAGGAPQHQ